MTHLAAIPARRIIAAISDAAERFVDADFPPRVRLLNGIVERTGYSVPVVEFALDELFGSITAAALTEVIDAEVGSVAALDGAGGRNVCILSSRTTIGVAIVPAVFALCAKCDVLVKDREDGLVRAFFAALAQELPEFAQAAQARAWESAVHDVDLASFDTVVAFGSDASLKEIVTKLAPTARFIGYGSKASVGYIGAGGLPTGSVAREIARGAARDLLLYDTEGCLSLHHLFIDRAATNSPRAFAELLAREVRRAAIEFPLGDRDPAAVARVANARNVAAFRAASGLGHVFSDETASYLIVLDAPLNEPPLFLPRALTIQIVDSSDQAVNYLNQFGISVEAIAIAPPAAAKKLSGLTSRFVDFGMLQRPGIGGKHGDRPRIAEFI